MASAPHHQPSGAPPPSPAAHDGRVPGSFRDPSGFVFVRDGVLYRHVDERYRPDYERLVDSGLGADLIERGVLIRHVEVPESEAPWFRGYRLLRPRPVPFVSYPYEWSFSQLRDAALLTLRIQARAMKFGMSLKDASAFNVQFVDGAPVLIDTLSFERYVDGRPWVAYRQFCQHFLAPLALGAYRDVRLAQLLRVFLDGVPLDLAAALLPRRTWLRPGLATHIHLHARALRRYSTGRPASSKLVGRVSRSRLAAWLEHLASVIRHLRWDPSGTEWVDYYAESTYTDAAFTDKERLVSDMLDRRDPSTVWDIGANVGRFSRLAASRGALTVAFDLDPAAVERHYLHCRSSGERRVLPLVLDLANPSADCGWAGEERVSLGRRGPADCVMALALVHHVAIGLNIPFDEIARFLAGLGRSLIIEFVPKSDAQVQRLLAARADIFDAYTQAAFEAAFSAHWRVEAAEPIHDTNRVLYEMTVR